MPTHTVEEGDCISSIAAAHGVDWEEIYDLSDNEELFDERNNPSLLVPGDEVVLPDPEANSEADPEPEGVTVTTNRRHTFVVRGMTTLCLKLEFNEEALAGEPYRVEVEERTIRGETDDEGFLRAPIPPTARTARLVLEERNEQFELNLGGLRPPYTIEGASARFQNLGLFNEITDFVTPGLRHALIEFQEAQELHVSGRLDEPTIDKLVELHGC